MTDGDRSPPPPPPPTDDWMVCERCGAPHISPRIKEAPNVFSLICAQCGGRIFVKLYRGWPLELSTD